MQIQVPRSLRIGITGSPGTGKKSVALELARMSGLQLLSINDFAIEQGFGSYEGNEFIVDLKEIRRAIRTSGKIVCGHLLPYVVPNSKMDNVAVLRCPPRELKLRYLKRGYSPTKVRENLEAELIGVISSKARAVYGRSKLFEFDSSENTPRGMALKIANILNGKEHQPFGMIDWLSPRHSPRDLISSIWE